MKLFSLLSIISLISASFIIQDFPLNDFEKQVPKSLRKKLVDRVNGVAPVASQISLVKGERSVDSFDCETLRISLDFLDFSDLSRVSLVCGSFYNVSNEITAFKLGCINSAFVFNESWLNRFFSYFWQVAFGNEKCFNPGRLELFIYSSLFRSELEFKFNTTLLIAIIAFLQEIMYGSGNENETT